MFDFFKKLFGGTSDARPEKKLPAKHNGRHFSKVDDVNYFIDIDELPFYYYGKCGDRYMADFHFIPSQFQDRVAQFLFSINAILKSVHQKFPLHIPLITYHTEDLKFNKLPNSNMFSMFCHHPLNYSGKPSKDPFSISLRFGEKDNTSIQLYFNKFGYLHKINLICWIRQTLYKFQAEPFQNELQIVSAYQSIGVKETCIFDIKKEAKERHRLEYEWICENLPELAPKTLGGYTKMKNSKSKKYLEIGDAAYKLGISLD